MSNDVYGDLYTILKHLNSNGQLALLQYLNEQSDFQKHSNPYLIAKKFYADPNINKNIYHYTSIDSLKNILLKRQFFVGSINDMNDPMEIKYTYSLALRELKKLGASAEEINTFKDDSKVPIFDTYIWSFTYNDHSQALQNYGEIALEFNTQKVQEVLANRYTNPEFENMQSGNGYVFSINVEYDLKTQEDYIMPVIIEWLRAYRGLRFNETIDLAKEIRMQCLQALFLFSICFKREKYEQEQEIRFVIARLTHDNDFQNDLSFNGSPKSIADISPDMLNGIVVTHKNHADRKIDYLRHLLDKQGFNKTKVRLTSLDY